MPGKTISALFFFTLIKKVGKAMMAIPTLNDKCSNHLEYLLLAAILFSKLLSRFF